MKKNISIKQKMTSQKLYKAVGPYSQAIRYQDRLLISGLLGLDQNGTLLTGGLAEELNQILTYLDNILAEAGLTKDNLLHVRVYLTDLANFNTFNKIYESYLKGTIPPTRECIQVSKLPKNVSIEIVAEAGY